MILRHWILATFSIAALSVIEVKANADDACATTDPGEYSQVLACVRAKTKGSGTEQTVFGRKASQTGCTGFSRFYGRAVRQALDLRKRDSVDHLVPGCETLARAIVESTGQPLSWAPCLGYGTQPTKSHMQTCLESYVANVHGDDLSYRLPNCAQAVRVYERALTMSGNTRSLPDGYTKPDCEMVGELLAEWSGEPADSAVATTTPQPPTPVSETPPVAPTTAPAAPDSTEALPNDSIQSVLEGTSVVETTSRQAAIEVDDEQEAMELQKDREAEARLDELIAQVNERWSDEEQRQKQREVCYAALSEVESLRTSAKQQALNESGLFGAPQAKDFETFVEFQYWSARQQGVLREIPDRCGWFFLEFLEDFWFAPRYALASFSASHNVDPEDDVSAEVLSVLYRAGRGVYQNRSRADALAAAAEVRRLKVAGFVGPPREKEDHYGNFGYYYGAVPEDFDPPMPEISGDRQTQILMTKITPNTLYKIIVNPFHSGSVQRADKYEASTEEHRLAVEDISSAIESGGAVIACDYNAETFNSLDMVQFWYESRPESADPDRLRERIPDHPLLELGPPVERCPATLVEARALVPRPEPAKPKAEVVDTDDRARHWCETTIGHFNPSGDYVETRCDGFHVMTWSRCHSLTGWCICPGTRRCVP